MPYSGAAGTRVRHPGVYEPSQLHGDAAAVTYATDAVFKFKRVLHDNDPAYGIFKKEWGQPVADAFFYLKTRHHPALPPPDQD